MPTPHQDPIVIVGAARTPMGAFQGDFSDLAAHDLGGAAIKAAVARAGVAPEKVDEVLFGNCLMAGQGQAPARQAGFKGGLPRSTGAVTLSKMCGARPGSPAWQSTRPCGSRAHSRHGWARPPGRTKSPTARARP